MVSLPQPTEPVAGPSTGLPEPDGATPSNKPLDIVFLQDTTGSQGPYIQAARKAIRDICNKISTTGQLDRSLIRFGLIAFRDHPPQDRTYVTKNFGFTNDIDVMQKNLSELVASGGGDGPEAQTAAIADALNTKWAEKAVKLAILITDAPPHGLGEMGDGFSASPDQNDPLVIARQMAERGITLFVIACEPTLSTQYKHAVDFYEALTRITGGQVFPLLLANQLGDFIVGTALETIETEKLIEEFEQVIIDDVYSNAMPVEKVADNLQQFMQAKGKKINSVVMEDVYVKSEAAMGNQRAWSSASTLAAARGKVQVIAEPRILPQWQAMAPSAPGYGAPPRFTSAPFPMARPTPGAPWARGGIAPTGASLFGAPAPSPAAVPVSAAVPSFLVQSQQMSQSQAQRVVMQSVARNSSVTSTGLFSKKSGQAAARSEMPLPS
ncbi:elongation factor-2 kinase [Pholiota molesta]|nr:elongation factor-2 kinase [Pholiota molesta]